MYHKLSIHNFHGWHHFVVIAPIEGGVLSVSQTRRIRKILCPYSDCCCGGGYGEGWSNEGARLVWSDDYPDRYELIPEARRKEYEEFKQTIEKDVKDDNVRPVEKFSPRPTV